MTEPDIVRDQSYVILRSGDYFAVHGDQPIPGPIFGDLAFALRDDGPYADAAGKRYAKGYLQTQRFQDRALSKRRQRTLTNSYLELPGSAVDSTDVVDVVTVEQMREDALCGPYARLVQQHEAFVNSIIVGGGEDVLDGLYGLTGSIGAGLRLDGSDSPHDVDLVVSANPSVLMLIVEELHARYDRLPAVRIFEYGKSWRVRQLVEGVIFCPFFRTSEPLVTHFDAWEDKVTSLRGVVVDADGSALTPSRIVVNAPKFGLTEVYLLGLRSRGDIRRGDDVRVNAHWADVIQNGYRRRALVCVEDAPILLQGRRWKSFYDTY